MEVRDQSTPEDVVQLGMDLLAAKRYYLGVCALLLYDWLLTFSSEYRLMWTRNRGPIFTLYLFNRYIPMAFMVITLVAYFIPAWTYEVCNRFAIVEWIQALLNSILAELVLLFRTFAMTGRSRIAVLFLACVMFSQCIVVFYAMSIKGENQALPLPDIPIDAFHMCILYSDPHMDLAYLILTIIFDLTVFIITLFISSRSLSWRYSRTSLYGTMLRDGALYFFVIFSGNLIWMILALTSRPGLKLANAQPSMLSPPLCQADMKDEWAMKTFDLAGIQFRWPTEAVPDSSIQTHGRGRTLNFDDSELEENIADRLFADIELGSPAPIHLKYLQHNSLHGRAMLKFC
ncbi:hypothetical protein DL96DRAFT_1813224 [Flagelloscypha sp. PMI_526]|nr:hypothetical protein DL96DRAFT_1813224 [Flagelloscypha sp. PMI_526]